MRLPGHASRAFAARNPTVTSRLGLHHFSLQRSRRSFERRVNVSQSIRKRDWIDLARNSDPLRVRPVLGAQRTIGDESLSGMESGEWGEADAVRDESADSVYQCR